MFDFGLLIYVTEPKATAPATPAPQGALPPCGAQDPSAAKAEPPEAIPITLLLTTDYQTHVTFGMGGSFSSFEQATPDARSRPAQCNAWQKYLQNDKCPQGVVDEWQRICDLPKGKQALKDFWFLQ